MLLDSKLQVPAGSKIQVLRFKLWIQILADPDIYR